jgi:2-amino-4-hydroxy-6-hydroxymethyldihydropteridine diphosphokinase
LGSNLGDRHENLAAAIESIGDDVVKVLRCSSTFETAPMYNTDQPRFLNQVVEIETSLFPRQLLSRTRAVERMLGRTPSKRNHPRRIDIDILFYGDVIVATPDLEVPHPRIAERRFVLEPLAELAPDLRHPWTGRSVREMLDGVRDQNVTKTGGA